MEMYLHFRICLQGVCKNNFTFIVVSFSLLFGVFWLYYHAFSTAQVTSNGWMAVNEQGRMWKEADAKYFKDAALAFVWIE